MRSKRSRLAVAGVLALALSVTAALPVVGVEAAKKKKKTPTTFAQQLGVNAAVPDDAAVGPSTPLVSTITVPKKFKKKVVGDVNLTGFQSTGSGVGAANDLEAALTSPGGRTTILFDSVGDVSIGPWTLDDDTKTSICNSPTPTCLNPLATLLQPFAGTSNLTDEDDDVWPLATHNGVRMNGTWTLTVWDDSSIGQTSTLNSWGLKIEAAKPVK